MSGRLRKVCVVTLAPPPSGGSHATRIFALVKGLSQKGSNVTLITSEGVDASLKEASTQYQELKKHSNLIETNGGVMRAAARAVGKASIARRSIAPLVQRIRSIVRRYSFPDTFITWIPGAVVRGVKHIRKHGADVIISSGAPFSAHIASYIISLLSGTKLVLDYGDPWVYEPGRPRRGLRLFLERYLEALILNRAMLISFTTQATIDLYRRKFPGYTGGVHLYPMGYSKSDYENICFDSSSVKDKLSFVYAGRVNEEYRSLDGLTKILNTLAENNTTDVEFIFYGAELGGLRKALDPYLKLGLVRLCDNLEHKQYISEITRADGLVIFGNNNYIQIPGKAAHFLAANRPILYFPNVKDIDRDPTYDVLVKYQKSGVYNGDYVNDFYKFKAACVNRELISVPVGSMIDELEWGFLTRAYLNAIEGLIGEKY